MVYIRKISSGKSNYKMTRLGCILTLDPGYAFYTYSMVYTEGISSGKSDVFALEYIYLKILSNIKWLFNVKHNQ